VSYRWVEHTAELELEIDAPTEEAVFTDSLLAIGELLSDEAPAHAGERSSIELSLAGAERTLLLADWLDELVFRAETEQLVPLGVERIELDGQSLRATVRAARAAPRPLVKGVTHHRLAFERHGEGFRATVVLDV
jgi:SHS2 domain-containing protein